MIMDEAHVSLLCGEIRPLNPLEKEKYPAYKYATVTETRYMFGDYVVTVPSGFLTDGSSGGPDYGRSWLIHDFLYATHKFTSGQECSRNLADETMERILRFEGMGWYCWLVTKLSKLNVFWLFSKAWRTSGLRGAEYLEGTERSRKSLSRIYPDPPLEGNSQSSSS